MLGFEFCSPTKFVFGKESQVKVGSLVKEMGGSRVLVVYGGGSVVRSGLLAQVLASLDAAAIPHCELGGVLPNPRSGLVYEGIRLCREQKIDFVLPVGGGSAIDTAKAIALGATYDGDFWDFFCGKAVPEKGLAHGVVLTIPAAGSEGSNSAVITLEDGMFKRGVNTELNRPRFAIMNPELTYTLPAYQTASGVVDMMAHIMERYFTNTPDVDLTDRMAEALLLAIIKAAPIALETPTDYASRATLMWAGTLAHNNSVGVGREQDWGSHQIEHELSALYDCAHGAGLAVVFPAWMRYVVGHNPMRFAQFAQRVWGCEMDYEQPMRTAIEGINRTKAFFESIDMPVTFEQIGAKAEDIPALASKVVGGQTGRFVTLSIPMIEEVLKLAL